MQNEQPMKHKGTAYGKDPRMGQMFTQRYHGAATNVSHKVCEMRVRRCTDERMNEAQIEIAVDAYYHSGRSTSQHFSVCLRGDDLEAFIKALQTAV